jgi:amino acid transporter
MPLNAIFTSLIMAIIVALINIGSSEALGIILSIYNSALLASYTITISCILLHRLQGRSLPQARYTLGKWGALVNVLALIYIIPLFVFSFFPPTPNPTPATMNWAVVMVGGTVIFATVYYIAWGRKKYTPPNEVVEDYIERYQTAMMSLEKEGSIAVIEESVELKEHNR